MAQGMTYAGTGVSYDQMDPFKRMAQQAAREINGPFGIGRDIFEDFEPSRGESAYLMRTPDGDYLAHVEEGLGTKNLVADAIYQLIGRSFYEAIAQDTVAMIVNDLITLGALPLSVAMHLAVGDSAWFEDKQRAKDLIEGWAHACRLSGCAWGGGETPTLKGIVNPGTVVLSGSAMGFARQDDLLLPERIEPGNAIILLGSSGIHANGLTLARNIASKLPKGYLTEIEDGRTFGEALLDPTVIYVPFIRECLEVDSEMINYAVNITGHGWRKLMRAPQPFAYIIERIPEPQPVFRAIQGYGPVSDEEAYGNLNMGAGFAVYVPEAYIEDVMDIATRHELRPLIAGYVEESRDRRVSIQPKGIEFLDESLQLR